MCCGTGQEASRRYTSRDSAALGGLHVATARDFVVPTAADAARFTVKAAIYLYIKCTLPQGMLLCGTAGIQSSPPDAEVLYELLIQMYTLQNDAKSGGQYPAVVSAVWAHSQSGSPRLRLRVSRCGTEPGRSKGPHFARRNRPEPVENCLESAPQQLGALLIRRPPWRYGRSFCSAVHL